MKIENKPIKKITTLTLSLENKRALLLYQSLVGARTMDSAIWTLLDNYRPDLLRKVAKTIEIEQGD